MNRERGDRIGLAISPEILRRCAGRI